MATTNCSVVDIGCWIGWSLSEVKLLLVGWVDDVLTAILHVINSFSPPSFLTSVQNFSFPDSMMYFLNLFQVQYGVGVIVSALIFRFVIKLIPFIG